jgi:hypothetical protein
MQWSKLRASVRALICPELRRRVDFHVTHYRAGARSKSGIITIDGERFLTLSYHRFCREGDGWFLASRYEKGAVPLSAETTWCPEQRDEIHPPQQLGDAMRAYLDMPIKAALKSKNPFIRSLAIIDRRIGKRTLEELRIANYDHSLVKEFYRLRMSTFSTGVDPR